MDQINKNNFSLQALLRFAVEQTKSEDAKNISNIEIDDDRREFLNKAFAAMTMDVMKEFEVAITVLDNETENTMNKTAALNTIREFIDNIDFANSFAKVGGIQILLKHLKSNEGQIKVPVLYIIAEMSQNNPFCQKIFLEENVLPDLIANFQDSEDIASSALHATSALVRNYEPGLIEFLRISGINHLINSLNTNCQKVFVKACFLIGNLSMESTEVRNSFVQKNAIEKLSTFMEPVSDFDAKAECLLLTLSELTKSQDWKPNKQSIEAITDELKEIVDQNKDLVQCQEIVEYANIILQNIEALQL